MTQRLLAKTLWCDATGIPRDSQRSYSRREQRPTRRDQTSHLSPIKIALDDKLQHQEEGLNNLDARLEAMETRYAQLSSDYTKLQVKTDDLENRGRRCNLRIIGVPEGLEKGNPTKFIAELLYNILGGPNGLEGPPILDRAHRAAAQVSREGDRPRPFILRVHYFQEKERIQRLARQKGWLEFQGKQILIFLK